jgi:hypothetical protein
MSKKDLRFLLVSFITWRIFLFIFLFLAISIVPLQMNFLGGGLESYLAKPYLWAWANFDGEHYLSIAFRGYQALTYFYFPLYPLLIGFILKVFSPSFLSFAFSGLLISHAAFLIGIIGLVRLVRIDYKKEVASLTILSVFLQNLAKYKLFLFSGSLYDIPGVYYCCYFWDTGGTRDIGRTEEIAGL